MALFNWEAARLLARANWRASASAFAFIASDWWRTIGFKSSGVCFARAFFGVGAGFAGSFGTFAISFLGAERASTFLVSAFGSGGYLAGAGLTAASTGFGRVRPELPPLFLRHQRVCVGL